MENKQIIQAELIAKAVKNALHQNANSNIGINANNCRDILEASLIQEAAKAVVNVIDAKNKGSRTNYDFQVACKEVAANHEAYSIDRAAIDRMSDMFKRINPNSLNTKELMAEFFKQYVTAVEVGGQFFIDSAKHDYEFDMFMIKCVKTVLSEKFSSNFADDRFAPTKMPNQHKGIGHNYNHFGRKYGEVKVENDEVHVFGPQSEIKRAKIAQHLESAAKHHEKAQEASLKKFEKEAIEAVMSIASESIEEGSSATPDSIVRKDLMVMKSISNMYTTGWNVTKAEEEAAFNAYKLTQTDDESVEDSIQNDDTIKKALSFGPEVNQGLSSMARKASNLNDKPIQYTGLLALFADNGFMKKGNLLNFDSEYPKQAMANLLPDEYMSGAAHLIKNSSELYTISIIAGRKGITQEDLPAKIVTDGSDQIIDENGNVFEDAYLSSNTPVGLKLKLIKKDNGRLAYAIGYHQIKQLRSKHVTPKVVINLYLAGNGKRVYQDSKLVGFEFNESAQENIDRLNKAIKDGAEFVAVATKSEMFLVAKRVVDGKDSFEFISDIDPSGNYKDYDREVQRTSSKLKAYMNGMVITNVRTSVAVDEKGQAKAVLFAEELNDRLDHEFTKKDFLFKEEEVIIEEVEEDEEIQFGSVHDYSMFLDSAVQETTEEVIEEVTEEEEEVVVNNNYSEFESSNKVLTEEDFGLDAEESLEEEEEEFWEDDEEQVL